MHPVLPVVSVLYVPAEHTRAWEAMAVAVALTRDCHPGLPVAVAVGVAHTASDVAVQLAGRRAILAERETALQRWALALNLEAAHLASESRRLSDIQNQVSPALTGMGQARDGPLPFPVHKAVNGVHGFHEL